jgi:hypothetical protein
VRRLAWLVILAACARKPSDDARAGSASAPSITLVGCAPALRPPGDHDPEDLAQVWTPMAASTQLVEARVPAERVVTAAVRARLTAIASCTAGKHGSLRVMLGFAADGSLRRVRTGGFGDAAVEACVPPALGPLKLAAAAGPFELACDLSTGLDTPWRVTTARSETVVVTAGEVRFGGTSIAAGAPALPAGHSYLVLADPDTPGPVVDRALGLASAGWPVLVAIQSSGGPPVFVALAASSPPRGIVMQPAAGALAVCTAGTQARSARLVDVRAVDRATAETLAACVAPCERAISLATTGRFVAKDLVAAASAARRAGIEPVIVQSARCAAAPAP